MNTYGLLISDLSQLFSGDEARTRQSLYENSLKYIDTLANLENYEDFNEEAKMCIRSSLKYNPELSDIAAELETPSKFPIRQFYTKTFASFFNSYKTWASTYYLQDLENLYEEMLFELLKELDEMGKIIIPNIPEGIDALSNIQKFEDEIKNKLRNNEKI